MRIKTRLLATQFVTHDVKRFIMEKPKLLSWQPGQGVLMAINEPGFDDKDSPFTPTSLPGDELLEFTIKRYADRHGVTDRLHRLAPGAELVFTRVFGDILYRGPGVFIAGGAGITPFLAILRSCRQAGKLKGNRLIFSNKKWEDIVCERELCSLVGGDCAFILTDERRAGYESRRVDEAFLKKHIQGFKGYFYICGPPSFISDVKSGLLNLGASEKRIVFDEP